MRKWIGTMIVIAFFVVLIILFTAVLPPLPTWIYIVAILMAMSVLVYVFSRK